MFTPNKKLQFGTWDDYSRVADYNKNGLDEVMFFALFSSGFIVNIYEYQNGKLERVLESPFTYSSIISGVETIIEKNRKHTKTYGSGGGENQKTRCQRNIGIGMSIAGIKK